MRSTCLLLLLAALGCGDDRPPPRPDAAIADGGPADAGPPDAGAPSTDEPMCDHAAGGPASTAGVDVDLSAVHADVRFFGALPSTKAIDEALADAIEATGGSLTDRTAAEYALLLDGVCAVRSDERALGAASVALVDGIAIVEPGTGDVTLPAGTTAVALDLRDASASPELGQALERAAAAILDAPLPALPTRLHARTGLTDEAFVPNNNVYYARVVERTTESPAAGATERLPIAVLTSDRMPPEAARLAVHLRAVDRAFLVGAPVDVGVAESSARAVGDATVVFRDRELLLPNGNRLPDLLRADHADLSEVDFDATPGPLRNDTTDRAPLQLRWIFQDAREPRSSPATIRAALLTAHGAAKLFHPYLSTIGDVTDERLRETLESAGDAPGRRAARNVLRRFGNALEDGHNWVVDPSTVGTGGILPVVLDRDASGVFVTRSYSTVLEPGERVTAVDGVPMGTWLDMELGRSYGATDGFRFVNAALELTTMALPAELTVEDLAGVERAQAIAPELATGVDLFAGSTRGHGPLVDLGAPDVYYMNLDGRYVGDDATVTAALEAAAGSRAMVIDMRGHPASAGATWDPYRLLQLLIREPFDTPRYRVPQYEGGERIADSRPFEQSFLPLSAPAWEGPVVMLIDHMAVSFAEDFGMMIVHPGRVTVVGRRSAGTTGSVTGMQLPGGFAFYFTGMEARWPDDATFHGEGVVPDVVVAPTAADYAAGRDPFLEAALETLAP